ncbi:MAG: DUF6455 family protein [Woeseiaceae bacterium]
MDGVESYVAATVVVIGIVSVMIVIRGWRNATISNSRMYRMMLTCGIDEMTARDADQLLDMDMQDARMRCRRCPAPDTCDRWLNGEAVPGNDFCPNAARFMAAADTSQLREKYEPSRRPGRRLD